MQAEEAEWQPSTTAASKSIPNLKLSFALVRVLLSEHSLISFDFTLAGRAAHDSKVYYSRCLSEDTTDRFGAEIPALVPLAPPTGASDHTDRNVTPAEIDCLINDTAATLGLAVDSVDPLKTRLTHHRRLWW